MPVGLEVAVKDRVEEAVALWLRDLLGLGVPVRVAEGATVPVPEAVAEGEAVPVGDALPVAADEALGAPVAVVLLVAGGVAVPEGLGV